jgi:hypothetical protein
LTTLHVHLDESGDFHFTPRGSKWYVFAVAWTYVPAPLANELTALRFGLVKAGEDLDAFHACEDAQNTRNLVVSAMARYNTWNFASLVIEKRKVNPSVRDEHDFYPKFASMLLRFVFRGRVRRGTSRVLVYTDTLPMTKHRRAVEATIKVACRSDLGGTPFQSLHHKRQSNNWIQVADYCSWSVFRKWEGGDLRTYDQLRLRLATAELNVMARGDGTVYY